MAGSRVDDQGPWLRNGGHAGWEQGSVANLFMQAEPPTSSNLAWVVEERDEDVVGWIKVGARMQGTFSSG